MQDRIRIGKIVAVQGLEGTLVVQHDLGKKASMADWDAVFIEMTAGSLIPYFPLDGKARTETETWIRLEGVDTPEKAKKFIRKPVWISEELFRKVADKKAPISLLGYTVIADGKLLGPVLEVVEQPHQILLKLEITGKEVFIPLHEETLRKSDSRKRTLDMTLPEGLLDIYLS